MPNKAETFARSETHINLMRAFAGESQARNRYTIAAGMAREKNLYVVQQVFLFTADQELTHAKQFYRQLADLSGQTIRADGTYPVDLYPDLLSHLRAAQHNEFQEWEHDYAAFAKVAYGASAVPVPSASSPAADTYTAFSATGSSTAVPGSSAGSMGSSSPAGSVGAVGSGP